MTKYLYFKNNRKLMPSYQSEERNGILYVTIDVICARKTLLPDFAKDISTLVEENKEKHLVIDAQNFPYDDTSKSRLDSIAALLPNHPNLRLKIPSIFAKRYKDYFGKLLMRSTEGYYLNTA